MWPHELNPTPVKKSLTSKEASNYPKVGQATTCLSRGFGPDIQWLEAVLSVVTWGFSVSEGQQAPRSPS